MFCFESFLLFSIDKNQALGYTFYTQKPHTMKRYASGYGGHKLMTLWDELYFEITLHGRKSELKKFVCFLESEELSDFFEMSSDYIIYDDAFNEAGDEEETEIIFTNDDYGIEIDEFDTDEFLEVFCKAARRLEVYGTLYDNDDEYRFTSSKGDSYYVSSKDSIIFNDELDEVASSEEGDED